MSQKLHKSLRNLREKRNITQKEIAQKLGMSRPSYISVEKGKKELSLSEAQKIANIFGIGLEDLKTGTIPNFDKYKEMILLFLRFSELNSDGKLPKTKLAKLLYLADFSWFYENMQSMSGMQYRHIKYGPVPDSYFRALDELEEEGRVERDNKEEAILISENESSKKLELKELAKAEINLIHKIAKKWKNKKTNEIVNFTHNQLPYKVCLEGEIIPYELIIQEDPNHVY